MDTDLLDADLLDVEFCVNCPVCGDRSPAEFPPCTDGHGGDCTDRICSRCGTALFLDPFITVSAGAVSAGTVSARSVRRYGAA